MSGTLWRNNVPKEITALWFSTGFDSDNSSGDFSEANHKVTEMLDLDPHQSNRTEKHNRETEIQENGIKRHR